MVETVQRIHVWVLSVQRDGEARIVDTYANTKVRRNVTSGGSLGIDHESEDPTAGVPVNSGDPQRPKSPTQSAFAASRIDVDTDRGAHR